MNRFDHWHLMAPYISCFSYFFCRYSCDIIIFKYSFPWDISHTSHTYGSVTSQDASIFLRSFDLRWGSVATLLRSKQRSQERILGWPGCQVNHQKKDISWLLCYIHYMIIHDYIWLSWLHMIIEKYIYITLWKINSWTLKLYHHILSGFTSLSSPMIARVYVNLLEGISHHISHYISLYKSTIKHGDVWWYIMWYIDDMYQGDNDIYIYI